MIVILMVACVVFWFVAQYQIAKQGIEPRSRGSLRYQRRKARDLSESVEDVNVRPRGSPRAAEPFAKIVRDHNNGWKSFTKPPQRRR